MISLFSCDFDFPRLVPVVVAGRAARVGREREEPHEDAAFTEDDALLSAKAGASEMHHSLAHTLAFDEGSLPQVLPACLKSAFFVMRSLLFASSGEYPATRARAKDLVDEDCRLFLDAYDLAPDCLTHRQMEDLAESLLRWSEQVVVDPKNVLADCG